MGDCKDKYLYLEDAQEAAAKLDDTYVYIYDTLTGEEEYIKKPTFKPVSEWPIQYVEPGTTLWVHDTKRVGPLIYNYE